ncbi:hypothetical protein BT96DRAFT_821209 [Gymnopus androsaceus JB14]|uniref:Carbohydrate-binding module family 19 domain-containing protein n=1 Tax=Gymnopus androsaceus JB14 TaxID=1447944 RepID=A0A6A4HJH4_9AGAR|nr:hypothetical protein BT96DRAFT_821209 [Gymnopus androsaceus JB14]
MHSLASQLVFTIFIVLSFSVAPLHGAPTRALTKTELLANGKLAQKLNAAFQTLSVKDTCVSGEIACISGEAAECVGKKWETVSCGASLACYAIPSVTKANDAVCSFSLVVVLEFLI